ncbi:MAG: ABC transporter ATP-binding protein, partial [Clostridiales bacterium]|nr:ABC transporter ATP-binding protein [Clostridiales bacterium]
MLTADDAVISSEYSDNRLKLRVKSGDSYLIKLLKLFEKFEISPSEINSRKPTLNDVFLEITGKELRDHA